MSKKVGPAGFEPATWRITAHNQGGYKNKKCRIRKSGLGLLMDIHVVVDGDMPVKEGHQIGHDVKDRLLKSDLQITDVSIHIEPGATKLIKV